MLLATVLEQSIGDDDENLPEDVDMEQLKLMKKKGRANARRKTGR